MLNFNAHLGFQFTELPFLQRFATASLAGFKAVEFPSPYAYDASVLGDLLQEHKLKLVQFAAPVGETKGLAAVPGKEDEFRHGLKVICTETALGYFFSDFHKAQDALERFCNSLTIAAGWAASTILLV